MESTDFQFKPYKWLNEAAIFNKNNNQIPIDWLEANADVIVLLFTSYGVDKDGIIERFYEIYENVKFVNVPIEVIYVPMDDTKDEFKQAYRIQANWFTLKFNDPLVPVLKYMYGVTCIPCLVVVKTDGTIVSNQGVRDLEDYGKNAVTTWISRNAAINSNRNMSKEVKMYGSKWKYMNLTPNSSKPEYKKRFSTLLEDIVSKSSA